MTYETVTVVLSQHEMGRLRALAQRELRKPKDQAAYLLRNVLQSEGLENSKADSVKVFETTTDSFAKVNP